MDYTLAPWARSGEACMYAHTAAPVLALGALVRAVTPGVAATTDPFGRRVFYWERCSADGSSPWS